MYRCNRPRNHYSNEFWFSKMLLVPTQLARTEMSLHSLPGQQHQNQTIKMRTTGLRSKSRPVSTNRIRPKKQRMRHTAAVVCDLPRHGISWSKSRKRQMRSFLKTHMHTHARTVQLSRLWRIITACSRWQSQPYGQMSPIKHVLVMVNCRIYYKNLQFTITNHSSTFSTN